MEENELKPALERVAASVVETHRKRQQVEDELRAAQAVVESLKTQSSSLEASVVDLRRQLETSLQAKDQEGAAIAQLAAKREAAFEQLTVIARDVAAFLSEKDQTAAEVGKHIQDSRSHLSSVEAEVSSAKSAVGSLGNDIAMVRDKLGLLKRAADSADRELVEIQSKARELDGATDAMAARVCGIAETIEQAERSKQKAQAASDELRTLAASLDAKRAEAEKAAASVNEVAREHEQQTAALAGQLAAIAQLASSSATPNGSLAAVVEKTPSDAHTQPEQAPGSRSYADSLSTLELLAAEGFVTAAEAAQAAEVLRAGDVDKLVRSTWSRAMGGPAPAVYRLIIGQALSESGDLKGGITFFNQALASRHADPFIIYLVARSMLRMKKYVEVLKIAQLLSRGRNGKLLGRNLDGLHLQNTGRFDEAEKKLAEAFTMTGYPKLHYRETIYNLARLAESAGDARSATMWYEKLRADAESYRDIAVHIESLKANAQAV